VIVILWINIVSNNRNVRFTNRIVSGICKYPTFFALRDGRSSDGDTHIFRRSHRALKLRPEINSFGFSPNAFSHNSSSEMAPSISAESQPVVSRSSDIEKDPGS
jgi:hypothetical protein